jgi:ABC-type branched-subunit amino acid transport system substrate-binding protein
MLALSATSSSPELWDINDRFFSLSYSDDGIGLEIANQLSQYDTVAILSEQNDYNQAMLDVVLSNLSEDTEVIFDEQYVKGETNLRNDLEKLQAAGADAIFFNPNIGATAEAMATQMDEIGGWDSYMVTTFAMATDDVVSKDLDAMDGLVVVDAPRADDADFLMFVDEVVATQGTVDNLGNYYVAAIHDALYILTDLIMEHDGDVEAVRTELATGSFDGYLGSGLSFDGETFVQGVGTANFEVRDGELLSL